MLEGLCIDHNPTVHVESEGAQDSGGASPCPYPQFHQSLLEKFGHMIQEGNYHICIVGDNNAGFVTCLETIKDMHGYSEICLLNCGLQVPFVLFCTVVNLYSLPFITVHAQLTEYGRMFIAFCSRSFQCGMSRISSCRFHM